MVMEPGTLADARKALGPEDEVARNFPPPGTIRPPIVTVPEPPRVTVSYPEHPAACDHRADVLWLAHRLRISERRVGDLRRQKKHLERRLRKALRKGKH